MLCLFMNGFQEDSFLSGPRRWGMLMMLLLQLKIKVDGLCRRWEDLVCFDPALTFFMLVDSPLFFVPRAAELSSAFF